MSITRRRRLTTRKHIPHHELNELPEGVKLLAWARTVRWIGWGFGESLIPILLFSFSTSYAQAGLFSSVLEIASLLILPAVGILADKVSAKFIVLAGLILYPFVGISYFLAGVTGLALFILLARIANGMAWTLDSVGTDTYYRRISERTHLASSFGYIETFAHLGWIGAGLISIILVPFVPVHVLLLAVAPFSLMALPFVIRAAKDPVQKVKERSVSTASTYTNIISEFLTWDKRTHLLAVLTLFAGVIETLVWFFIPIDAFIDGANLTMVILLGVVASIPTLSAYAIGRIVDNQNKYGLIAGALVGMIVLLIGLALFPHYAFKLTASFLLGVLLEVVWLAGKYLVTVLGPSSSYGSRGSAFEGISAAGGIVAPLLLGVSFDVLGFPSVVLCIAGTAAVLAIMFGVLMRSKSVEYI